MLTPGLVSVSFRPLAGEEIIRLAKETGLAAVEWGGDVHVPAGDTARAKELAYTLPDLYQTRNVLLNTLLEGEERERHIRDLRSTLLEMLAYDIGTVEDAEYAARKVIALYALMYEDGDYTFVHIRLYDRWIILAKAAAERMEAEEALKALSEAEKHAIAFDNYVDSTSYTHTSPLFRGTHAPLVSMNYKENTAHGLLNTMKDPIFDFIRDNPVFEAVRTRVEPLAGEWKVR